MFNWTCYLVPKVSGAIFRKYYCMDMISCLINLKGLPIGLVHISLWRWDNGLAFGKRNTIFNSHVIYLHHDSSRALLPISTEIGCPGFPDSLDAIIYNSEMI